MNESRFYQNWTTGRVHIADPFADGTYRTRCGAVITGASYSENRYKPALTETCAKCRAKTTPAELETIAASYARRDADEHAGHLARMEEARARTERRTEIARRILSEIRDALPPAVHTTPETVIYSRVFETVAELDGERFTLEIRLS